MAVSDLDELVLRCRDDQARRMFAEAVSSYRAGAYRAAIVTCWLAVYFDFVEKLRELDVAGEKNATEIVAKLAEITKRKDLSAALRFEREILDVAQRKFELISQYERVDLERLFEDRNRCAHPSVLQDDTPYSPSPELVRAHLFNAVELVLSQPPAQGKFALDRILKELSSDYFPVKQLDAEAYLRAGSLRNPRETLLRAVLIELLKRVLPAELGPPRQRNIAALKALCAMHRDPYERLLRDKLSTLCGAIGDEKLPQLTWAMILLPASWGCLDAAQRTRFENWTVNLPAVHIELVDYYLGVRELKPFALQRLRRASRKEIVAADFFAPRIEIVDHMIKLYTDSRSFEEANQMAAALGEHVYDLEEDRVKQIISAAKNEEVLGSFGFPRLIDKIRTTNEAVREHLDDWLRDAELEQFALVDVEDDEEF